MKRYMAVLVMLLVMLTAATAQAMTDFEWSLRCLYKTAGTTTLYDCYAVDATATNTDLSGYRFEPRGTLEGGTYIGMASLGIGDKAEIMYYSNGVKMYAYIDRSSVASASVTVKASNGESYAVPEVCYANPDTWETVLTRQFGEEHARVLIDSMKYGTGTVGKGSTKVSAEKIGVYYVDENGEEKPVTIDTLGTAVSVIVLNKEKVTVPTADLRWETKAREDQMLAVVKAHKSGKASLRAKASTKGKVIEKVTTNRIVLVVEKGKTFTKVIHEGQVGYIINTALTYYPVGGVKDGEPAAQPGWVSFRGRLKSGNTVNIRQNGKNGSRILTDFKAGTPIMVFGQDKRWSEIEVGGYRAYILNEYVTLDDGTIQAE